MTIELETTSKERASWQLLRTTGVARAARDIDRLLADNEAKAKEIEYFKAEYQDTAGITQIKTERDFLVAEITLLKVRGG